MNRMGALLAALLVLALGPLAAEAQVRLERGEGERALDPVRALLERDDYIVLARDTTFGPDVRIESDVVVLDASVRLEGVMAGDVAILGPQGALFVRPGARIGETVYAVGGIAVVSGLADPVDLREIYVGASEVERLPDGSYLVRIETAPPPPFISLPGLFGLWLPTYDRVDGLSVPVLATLNPLRRIEGPEVEGRLTFRTARGALDGGLVASQRVGAFDIEATVERTTETEERWGRADLSNTGTALFFGSDPREYYRTDRAAVRAGLREGIALGREELRLTPFLEARHSRDRSLPTASPWSLFGTLDRPNAPIDDGTITSFVPGLELNWLGGASRFRGVGTVEHAVGGSATPGFTLGIVDGRWSMDALFDHILSIRIHARRPLGDAAAPRQRWTQLGGSATLPTLAVGEMRGDRVSFVQSVYRVPLGVTVPIAGSPELRLLHAAGSARATGEPSRDWEQNLGVGVRLLFLTVDGWVNPADADLQIRVLFGLTSPF